MKVAWHEMPGKRSLRAPSQRDGMIGVAQRISQTYVLDSGRSSDHTVPYGRCVLMRSFPGIPCQAIILRSLRDSNLIPVHAIDSTSCQTFEHEDDLPGRLHREPAVNR